ncbi:MAG: hypothetical protein JXX28_18995 [Deltaproteobacteria bacterium]|nr:hypothetical protein [Deltaproteobacteria bacterium]
MKRSLILLTAGAFPVMLLSCPPEAASGRRGREVEPPVAPPQEAQAPPPELEVLFPTSPPWEVGALPDGLASHSDQGCAACHQAAHRGWAASAHAGASPAFREAAKQAGTPACLACHLPLIEQHPHLVAYDEGDIHRPILSPNPAWDGGLQAEGVTCAACHLRDGKVVTSHPIEGAPHPTVWSQELGRSSACAVCHQLTWPGAQQPFYDTYGEWERSAYATAGVTCQSCHMSDGVDPSPVDHAMSVDPARAVTLLLRPATPGLVRGGAPLEVDLILQNTGAGHAFPTGNPWKGVRLEVRLVGPPDRKGVEAVSEEALIVDLSREVEEAPPWHLSGDTRLQAGEERAWHTALSLAAKAPDGPWRLRATLQKTLYGAPVETPLLTREVPLEVD